MAGLLTGIGLLLCVGSAHAQRTAENAVAEAEDAFGSAVGTEVIGLYTSTSARGFSPTQAGNLRIDGLYFDQAAALNARLLRGSSVHVGISAQGYPFPAPTGVVDFDLRVPGERPVTSLVVTHGALFSYDRTALEVDTQLPIVPGVFSLGGGATFNRNAAHEVAVGDENYNGAVVGHFTPGDDIALTAFWSGLKTDAVDGDRPKIILGNNAPPRFRADQMTSPAWLAFGFRQFNAGAYGSVADLAGWTVRAGAFRSINKTPRSFTAFLFNTDTLGQGDYAIEQTPPRFTKSLSGEVRASRPWTEGPRRHTVHLTARGRNRDATFGGGQTLRFGRAALGAFPDLALPTFVTGERTGSETHQFTGGLGYEGIWSRVGQLSLAAQKTDYKRTLVRPGAGPVVGRSAPWLYNGAAAAYLSPRLAAYAGYTRGLEELGAAPFNAVNRDEAVPAQLTRQVDAGVRYQFTPKLQFVAGAFQIDKPYFGLDRVNVFRPLGDIRHRGLEFSLAGPLTDTLTVVAGAVLLRARISDETAALGASRLTAVGPIPRLVRVNLQYRPPGVAGLVLDAKVESLSSRVVTVNNAFRTGATLTVDAGARYTTTVAGTPVRFRLQALNLANANGITPQPSGQIAPFEARRVELSVAADF
ncbi:MAG: hypothetical protein SFV21_19910, partial [Rhodospirillaceae bacterium]|nr:hypothetical protein [Rhodospirillaceae bacterium]